MQLFLSTGINGGKPLVLVWDLCDISEQSCQYNQSQIQSQTDHVRLTERTIVMTSILT